MFSTDQINRFESLDQWFYSPMGQYVSKAIHAELMPLKQCLKGECLVQLGSCAYNAWLSGFRYRRQWLFTPVKHPGKMSCRTLLHSLPIARESIDCIVAPLTIDAFEAKGSVLDELDRILKPMGYVVFISINPLSLWGLWLKMSKNNCFGVHKGFPHSDLAMKRVMMLRGYTQVHYNAFYFIPPVRQQQLLSALEFFNQIGKMISPLPSAFYCLVMQKQVENYIGPLILPPKKEFVKSTPALQPM